MYKIYINEKPLILISSTDLSDFLKINNVLISRYAGKTKFLLNFIDMMEKGMKYDAVILHHSDLKALYKDIKSVASPVKAAGGIVYNDNGELLVIFRKGYWDLAKGHLDKKEKNRDAAVREVMEETGLKEVEIFEKAGKTYHIFKNKSRTLKISSWYFMKANQKQLFPEKKEDIQEAKWIDQKEFLDTHNMYSSIRDLLINSIKIK